MGKIATAYGARIGRTGATSGSGPVLPRESTPDHQSGLHRDRGTWREWASARAASRWPGSGDFPPAGAPLQDEDEHLKHYQPRADENQNHDEVLAKDPGRE